MIVEATPLAGLLLGFAGSTHCVAMCGGVASALDRLATGRGWRRVGSHLLYAFGRIASYALIGALVGGIGEGFAARLPDVFAGSGRWVVGGILIALGLSLMWRRGMRGLERLGSRVWRRLQPVAGRTMKLPASLRALALGAVWGWLPCGLVYSAAGVAAVTGEAGSAALFMAAFGLGTLPAVLSLGTVASGFWQKVEAWRLRGVTGALVVLCGVWTIVAPIWMRSAEMQHGPMCH